MGHPWTKAARRIAASKARKKRNSDFFGRDYDKTTKPNNKNLVMCASSHKEKLRFETEAKALKFIEYNAETIAESSGYAPIRAYWCNSCCCWHVTSKPKRERKKKSKNS